MINCMEEWKEYKALEFCYNVTDGTHDSPKPKEEGYYLITSKHLKDNGIDFASAKKISETDYLKVIQRSKVEQYDILYSMIGTIGNICQVKDEKVNFAVKNMGIFKMGGDELKSKWLYYWLKSPMSIHYVSSRLAGSTQSYLTLNSLREYPVLVPNDEDTMKRIVSILSSLDDKIEVNRRINEQLEELAQALFKSWFVDFEPFKDGEFVESELGMIPKGWKVGTLGEYCKVKSGYAFKSSWWKDKGMKVIKIKNITSEGTLDMNDCSYVELENTLKAKDFKTNVGDLLIAMTGATIGKFCMISSEETMYVNQRVGKFFLGNNPIAKLPFIYCSLKTERIYSEIINKGQGSAQPNISGSDIENIRIPLPTEMDIISLFNGKLKCIFEKIINNQQEILHLTTLRDTLLPKLMSGEMDVNERGIERN